MSDKQLADLVKAVASEWQTSGIGTDTIYGEFAMEVARRAVAAERQRRVLIAEPMREYLYRVSSQVPFEHAEWAQQRGRALLAALRD